MAHIIKDRVRESTTTTGTADFTLAGAVTDFYGFADVMANGDTTWYCAVLTGGGGWEVGLATFSSPSTLQRTTVLASSTGSKISFGAGTKDLFMDLPAAGLFTAAGGTLTGALNWATAATVASASTADIGAAASNVVNITGTTTITALGTIAAGAMRWVKFAGALTLTHNATSLILPGAANITTAANDVGLFVSEGSGNWRCIAYQRADGSPFSYTATDARYFAITRPANVQTGTTYTFVAGDAKVPVTFNNAAAITVTVNTGVHSAGDQIDIITIGAGKPTLVAGSGFTLNSASGNKSISPQYGGATLYFLSSTSAVLVGSLAA